MRRITVVLSALLLALWAVFPGPAVAGGTGDAGTAIYEKSEVVYASLGADGAVDGVYTVNGFSVENAGTVTDYGAYDSVKALNKDIALTSDGGVVTFDAPEGMFYYQGTAVSAALPWKIEVGYKLDGVQVDAERLAGASGRVCIHLTSTRDGSVDSVFADSFMQQVTFTLPAERCTDVVADGAAVVQAGANVTATFTVLPGDDADCTVSFDATDFTMDGIQIAAVPYDAAIEMPDTDGMLSQFDRLSSAIGHLASGASGLSDGIETLEENASGLAEGNADLADGLDGLERPLSSLVAASGEVDRALQTLSGSLEEFDFSEFDHLDQLVTSLEQLAGQLEQLEDSSARVDEAKKSFGDAWDSVGTALDQALSQGPDGTEVEALNELLADESNGLTDEQERAVSALLEEHAAIQNVSEIYEQERSKVEAAGEILDALDLTTEAGSTADALRGIASKIGSDTAPLDDFSQLAESMRQLAGQYAQFDEGLRGYARGFSALNAGYADISSGASAFASGISQLGDAARQLARGMMELDESASALPGEIREQMAELLDDYEFPEFDGTSFASSKNATVANVQFVLTTAPIETVQPKAPEEPEPAETLWDRIVGLFG